MAINFTVTTKDSNLNIRSGPSTDYSIVGKLRKGQKATAQSTSGGWYKLADKQYCCAKYCTPDPQPAAAGAAPAAANTVGTVPGVSTPESLARAQAIANKITAMINASNAQMYNLVENTSMRLFGLPHQLNATNDSRINSKSKLGRMFTQTFIMDAPLIYLKPGTSNFLPGLSTDEKWAMTGLFKQLANGDVEKTKAAEAIAGIFKDDDFRYFDFQEKFSQYMNNVNLLCRIGAVFLGLKDRKVPWQNGSATYGDYDWRLFTWNQQYTDSAATSLAANKNTSSVLGAFMNGVSQLFGADDRYIQFYVDASASFGESATNSTTSSMISSFTEQLEGYGKELSVISGMTGVQIDGLMNTVAGNVDDAIEKVASGDGAIANMLRRISGTGTQILSGSNFMVPEIWSDSEYGKDYSFSITLSTPYGNKESWYLNIFVPMMFALAFAIPNQTSANTFAAPFLIKAFAPGWFSCDMGIVTSISIDKAPSGDSWSSSGLPNEVKLTFNIKDLYTSLSLPTNNDIRAFFNNTGLINFLMVNCGVDITKTGLDDKLGVIANLFTNTIGNLVSDTKYGIWYGMESFIRDKLSLYH